MQAQSVTLYGISNCDTVRRARAWLTQHAVAHRFHDFKKQGLEPARLDAWMQLVGWEKLLNRQGLTWRRLDEATRASVDGPAAARALMLANLAIIKRPVVEWDDALTVGFDAQGWVALSS